jgi:phenylacetate-CoA ligase
MKKHWMVYTIPEEEQIKKLKKINPDVIYCFPSTLYLLGKIIMRNGIDGINPRIIISHGEILTKNSRKLIESAFEAEVFDQYGSTEFNRMGWECKMHEGLHIDVDSIVLEVIKDGEMEQVSAGGRGNIIVTGLANRLMPFIRYKIGDIGILSDEECECSRTFPLLERIEGRQDDFIVLPSRRIIAPRSIVHSIMNIKGIWKFKVVQKKKNKIEIKVVKDKDFSENIILEIEKKIKEVLAEPIEIDIKIVDDIPRNKHGKLKAIESKIKL